MTLSPLPDRQRPQQGLEPGSTGALVPTQRVGEAVPDRALAGVDVAVAVAHLGYGAATSVFGGLARRVRPLGSLLGHPPLVPDRFAPATLIADLIADLTNRGRADLESARREAGQLVRAVTPRVVRAV